MGEDKTGGEGPARAEEKQKGRTAGNENAPKSEDDLIPHAGPEPAEGGDHHKLYLDAKKNSEELLTRLKYMQADFENFRKRAARERIELIQLANGALVSDILPALDELEAALAAMKEGSERKGIEMVSQKMLAALKENGLSEIGAMQNGDLDPDLHEASGRDPTKDPKLDGRISRVIRKGYMLNGSVLRYANVAVYSLEK